MVTFLDRLVKAIKKNEWNERDFEKYSVTGVPRNVLKNAGIIRRYNPAEVREKDKEPLRKKNYEGAPVNRIGHSQIFYLDENPLEEEKQ